jgi:spore germination protein YaaH
MKRYLLATLLFITAIFSTPSFALENAFYILRGKNVAALNSLSAHYPAVDILISQAYRIRKDGEVAGFVNQEVLALAERQHVKVMPLVTNANFDPSIAHRFLNHPEAQRSALQTLLALCQKHHFYGLQFDFEGISIKDKMALTSFFRKAYALLHQHGFVVSFAIVPTTSDGVQPSDFLKRQYNNWAGAYDLQSLGKYSDFITLMAYDQHRDGTTPGSDANRHWVDAAIRYTLRFVPAHKLSLGIPTYSSYWYIRDRSHGKITVNRETISHSLAMRLLNKFHAELHWDNQNAVNYALYERDWMNEYLFIENAKSFQAKRDLAKHYRLRGISVFNLGNEDPDIWGQLKL